MYLFLLIYLATNILISKSEITIENTNSNALNKIDSSNCKHIKLPSVEDRVCLKINYKGYGEHKAIYVLAINKHETEYIKCYPDMQAVLVPMRNCNQKITRYKSQRKKRDLSSYSEFNENYKDRGEDGEILNMKESFDDIEYPNYEDNDNTFLKEEDRKRKENEDGELNDDVEYKIDVENKDNGENKADGELMEERKLEYEGDKENEEHKTDIEDKENVTFLWKEGEVGVGNLKFLPDDYDQNTSDSVDFNEYKKTCPTICPNRHIMVCAKCQHQVYRSFLSVCHLKAFSCKHPDEKLELVKRGPCVQSAPFFTGLPKVQGKMVEPNDEDVVLKFISCRQNGKLDTNDPKCKFENKNIKDAE